jgi:hypothetical protein
MQWPAMCAAVLAIDERAWEKSSAQGLQSGATANGTNQQKTPELGRLAPGQVMTPTGLESVISPCISGGYGDPDNARQSPILPSDVTAESTSGIEEARRVRAQNPRLLLLEVKSTRAALELGDTEVASLHLRSAAERLPDESAAKVLQELARGRVWRALAALQEAIAVAGSVD